MAARITTAFEKALLGALAGSQLPFANGIFLSLHSEFVNQPGFETGDNFELAGGGYSRVRITREGWTSNEDGSLHNTVKAVFPFSLGGGSLSVVRSYGAYDKDGVGDGDLLFYVDMDTPVGVGVHQIELGVGTIKLSIRNNE